MSLKVTTHELATIDDDILHDLKDELRLSGDDAGLLDDVMDEVERREAVEIAKHAPSWFRPHALPIVDGFVGYAISS